MAFQPTPRQVDFIKAAVFAACLLPTARLAFRFATNGLGANPIEYITRATGWWTLAFLAITLAVTPARRWLGMPWLLRLRRMFGLFAFFHACQHFTTYVWLDQFFDWPGILADIAKRPFVTVGFAAFVLLVPLAVTSTNAMVRRLGARRWQALHRLVYGIAILGVIHFWWLVKKDVTEPLAFAVVMSILLAARLIQRRPVPPRQRSTVGPAPD
jgi:methionine sulfoxide reductase heme-binding subunit